MDMYYITKNNGMSICVMIAGDRDEDGNITTCHDMMVIFRKNFDRGFRPIGGVFCPSCSRERRYRVSPERWQYVNEKYCHGELDI